MSGFYENDPFEDRGTQEASRRAGTQLRDLVRLGDGRFDDARLLPDAPAAEPPRASKVTDGAGDHGDVDFFDPGFDASVAASDALAPSETRDHVLAALLDEAVALMDQTSAIADPAEDGRGSPLGAAARLQLGARLARIGGWVLAQDGSSEEARRRASAELERARATAQDQARALGRQHRDLCEQVDRLVARARRLDALMNTTTGPAAARR